MELNNKDVWVLVFELEGREQIFKAYANDSIKTGRRAKKHALLKTKQYNTRFKAKIMTLEGEHDDQETNNIGGISQNEQRGGLLLGTGSDERGGRNRAKRRNERRTGHTIIDEEPILITESRLKEFGDSAEFKELLEHFKPAAERERSGKYRDTDSDGGKETRSQDND